MPLVFYRNNENYYINTNSNYVTLKKNNSDQDLSLKLKILQIIYIIYIKKMDIGK